MEQKKILVVNDSQDVLEVFQSFFQDFFTDIIFKSAKSAAEGIEIANKDDISIIITDWNMPPGINGGEMLKKIFQTKKIPAIIACGDPYSREISDEIRKMVNNCVCVNDISQICTIIKKMISEE